MHIYLVYERLHVPRVCVCPHSVAHAQFHRYDCWLEGNELQLSENGKYIYVLIKCMYLFDRILQIENTAG